MGGHKDKDGKFHPHNSSESKNVKSSDVKSNNNSLVNHSDAGKIKDKKSKPEFGSNEYDEYDGQRYKCQNCDTKYNSEQERDNCDSQISPECNKSKSGNISKNVKVEWEEKDVVESEHGSAIKYDATINYNGKKATFEFTDSINAMTNGDEPKDKDLLYAVLMDYSASQESRQDFLENFGYDEDSVKAHKIYDAVVGNASKMNKIFSSSEIDKLQEEFQDY